MEPKLFCQSCTMPIDNIADRGTEKDGGKSIEYCKYCYQNGALVNPKMTFEEMKSLVITQMKKMDLPPAIIDKSVKSLPYLKRWRNVQAMLLL
jgi:hypothetical protein